jgi:hypothetical protein
MRFERSRAACTRCYFAGPTCRGTYPGTVASSMLEAELDECRPYLSFVDRTARQGTSNNNRRKQGLKRRRASYRCSEAGAIMVYRSRASFRFPPMMVFAIGIKLPDSVPVQGLHDADPREHRWPAERHDQDQGFHSCLPFRRLVLGLREPRNVIAGILECDELAAGGKRDRILFEAPPPSFVGLQ